MAVVHLTKENFQKEVLESDIPVFVDFWASLVRSLPDGGPPLWKNLQKKQKV